MNTYSEDKMYKSYSSEVERMQKCIDELQQENQQLKNDINKLQKELNEENLQCSKYAIEFNNLKEKNKQLKDKLSKIETLIINHNRNIGDIYYKYNGKFLKSELKQRILDDVFYTDKKVSE